MRIEFIGSFVAFGLALLLMISKRRVLWAYLIAVAAVMCHFARPFYAAFPIGVALAAFLPRKRISASPIYAFGAIILAIYLAGYSGVQEGAFRPIGWVIPQAVPSVYVNMVGAVLLLIAVEVCGPIHSALSSRLGVVLGKLSFPLYLVHIPVLCSVGAGVFLALAPRFPSPVGEIAGALATIAASIAFAVLLARLNQMWVVRLNRIAATLVSENMRFGAPRTETSRPTPS
jgi:peptidoglycan/LPS O-acetylase OafA/YrhL